MHAGAVPVLQHKRVFESRDPDHSQAFMAAKEFHLDLPPREAKAFDFAASALYLPNSYIGYVQYGSAVTVRVPADRRRDDYFLHLPLSGAAEIVNDAGSVACALRKAVISSPAGHVMRSAPGSARLTVSLNRAATMAQLAGLLGDAPQRTLEFAPAIDLDSAQGQRLGRHVQLAIAELEEPATDCGPIMASMYEQLIVTTLLLYQPNSYSNALQERTQSVAPHDIVRAIDYMQGNLDAPITLTDIVRASGVPGRTLLKHFRDTRGTSPMRYLRHERLRRVREALMTARQDESVTEVALAWGFNHLGRFAVEYRRLFGESPSETLRRTRSLFS